MKEKMRCGKRGQFWPKLHKLTGGEGGTKYTPGLKSPLGTTRTKRGKKKVQKKEPETQLSNQDCAIWQTLQNGLELRKKGGKI